MRSHHQTVRIQLICDDATQTSRIRRALSARPMGVEFRLQVASDFSSALNPSAPFHPQLMIVDVKDEPTAAERWSSEQLLYLDCPIVLCVAADRFRCFSGCQLDGSTQIAAAPTTDLEGLSTLALATIEYWENVRQVLTPCAAPVVRTDVADRVSNGIVVTDPNQPDNPIVYCNSKFERITGYRADEIVGRNCRFLQGPKTAPVAVQKMRLAVHHHTECRVLIRNYRKTGEAFWNALSLAPVFQGNQQLVAYLGIQHDVTELVADGALAETTPRSEGGDRYGGATEAAEMLAHELKQPLASIASDAGACIEMLQHRRKFEHDFRVAVQRIERQSHRAGLLVERLKAFSMEGTVIRRQVCLRQLLTECVELVAASANQSQVDVAWQVIGEVSEVWVDPTLVRQALVNLLENGIRVTAQTAETPDEVSLQGRMTEQELHLLVRDHGPGLSDAELQEIASGCSDGHPNRLTRGRGLKITRQIAAAHGGRLWAERNSDVGLTLHITLPLVP